MSGTLNMTKNPCLEAQRQWSDPTAIILLNGHSIKLSSKFETLHPQTSANLRHHLRISLHSGWWLMQKLTTYQSIENKCHWSAQTPVGHLYHPSPAKAQGPSLRKG